MDSGKYLRPRTDGQGRYVQAMKTHDVVLCVGLPAPARRSSPSAGP